MWIFGVMQKGRRGGVKPSLLSQPSALTLYGKTFVCLTVLTAWRVQVVENESYLVDPASSHMLVSKIKPCMSKYKYFIPNCRRLIKTVMVYLMVCLLLG